MENMLRTELELLEAEVKEYKKVVEFAQAVKRLELNKDFKKVFTEGYFKDEAVRLVHLRSDPECQSKADQENILKALDAIGHLSQYLKKAILEGDLALKQIAMNEDIQQELIAEGLNNE